MDSFARAQARYDNSEHPDFDGPDGTAFAEAVGDEARAQIESDHELLAQLLSEQLAADAIKLLQADDAIAFSARCKHLLADAVEDFIGTVIRRVNDAISSRKYRGLTIGHMVQKAIGGVV